MRSLLQHLDTWLPDHCLRRLKRAYRRHKESLFRRQGTAQIRCGSFELEVPANHPLVAGLKHQPRRDAFVAITAAVFGKTYAGSPMVDIGANVGDTAARMASECGNPIICVEPSEYYLDFLHTNAQRIGQRITIVRAIVSNASGKFQGQLLHWGGTAVARVDNEGAPDAAANIPQMRLQEIAPPGTSLIKIDTDGYDFAILEGGLAWLQEHLPALLFESQITSDDALASFESLARKLETAGYRYWVVWDDSGEHLASLDDLDILIDINRFAYRHRKRCRDFGVPQGIHNLDILAVSERDKSSFDEITRAYRSE